MERAVPGIEQPLYMSWPEFLENHLNSLGPGDEAIYFQLFPGVYPSNLATHEDIRAGRLSVSEAVNPADIHWAQTAVAKGVTLRRLRALPWPEEQGYDQEGVQIMTRVLGNMEEAGQETMATWYDLQLPRLKEVCDPESEVMKNYLGGVAGGLPRVGVWLSRHGDKEVVGLMHYYEQNEGEPTVGALEVYPLSELPHDHPVRQFVHFWRSVLNDPKQSFPTENMPWVPS